jgi:hypothetical protein
VADLRTVRRFAHVPDVRGLPIGARITGELDAARSRH